MAAVPQSIAIAVNSGLVTATVVIWKSDITAGRPGPTIAFFLPLLHSGPWLCRKSFALAGLTTNRDSSSVRLSLSLCHSLEHRYRRKQQRWIRGRAC